MSAPYRFTESTTKRLAYGYVVACLGLLGAGFFVPWLLFLAAASGFGAGLYLGRLTEARENQKGAGIILGR